MEALIGWIIVGGLAGWLASIAMGTNRQQGCLFNIIIGILGAMLGGWLLTGLGMNVEGGFMATLFTAFVGAVILLFIRRQFFSGRRR